MQALPFHPNLTTHDHHTRIKHNIHHPIGKHFFAKSKNSVHFDIPKIVNGCPISILDKINTQSLRIHKSTFVYNHMSKIAL